MEAKISCDILIENGSVLLEDMTIGDSLSIAVKDSIITDILPAEQAKKQYAPAQIIDGKNKIWLPGLVDSHMHTGQQLLKGQILDELPMIWTRIMLPFESTLTPEKMRFSAQLAALEMIENGTTGFIESGSYFMEEAGNVYLRSGLRGALSCSTMDQGNLPASIRHTAEEAIAAADALYNEFHGQGNLQVFYSLRALMSCSEKLITQTAAKAKEKGTYLQAHMNEYAGEINYTLEKFGLRPFEYLEKLGVLSDKFIAAHCLMLSPKERELLAQHQIQAVHCPFSNCGKGVPDTPSLLSAAIPVALGTDGAAHGGLSMWNEMKIFRSVMNAVWGIKSADPTVMPAKTILQAAFNGRRVLHPDFAKANGGLQKNLPADIIAVDWSKTHLFASQNRLHTLLECVVGSDVSDSIINGRPVMRNREILTLDKEQIIWQAQKYLSDNKVTTC